MLTLRWITEMDTRKEIHVLVSLLICISCVSAGLNVPKPENLEVKMLDGQVIANWKTPVDAPPNSKYTVQMARYIDGWAEVEECTRIQKTYCDLSLLFHDYHAVYKVKVQLVTEDDKSAWTSKKFSLSETELQPPSFTLWATSSTLSISVHDKPLLKEIFPFGVMYTIFLEEKGQDNKTTTAYLKDDKEDAQRVRTFKYLQSGKEYCISMKVEGNGGSSSSSMSPKHCLLLPEKEWYIIGISSLSILSVLAASVIIVAVLLCYLKRPEKTPAALKSPASGWLPFSAGEDSMEVVTDKGWFLSRYGAEAKSGIEDPVTHVTVTGDSEEEERRTSTDSGISIEADSAKPDRGSPPMKQEDSGCGSLGGLESSTSGQTDYPVQDEMTHTDMVQKRDDSGIGLGGQLDSSSMILDCEPLKESAPGGSYRSQSPSALQEDFQQTLPHTAQAEVVTGYRAGPQACICSGVGQCTWCHKQGQYGSQLIKQYRHFVDSYKVGLTFPSYRKAQMDTVVVDDLEKRFIQLGEKFPLLTALSPVRLEDSGQDFNMNNVSLSLSDVQLTID